MKIDNSIALQARDAFRGFVRQSHGDGGEGATEGRSGSFLPRGANKQNAATSQTALSGRTPGSQIEYAETSASAIMQ